MRSRAYLSSVFASYLEPALELCAGFVHGLVALEQLDDEDGEVLVRAGAHRHRHRAHPGGPGKVNLNITS